MKIYKIKYVKPSHSHVLFISLYSTRYVLYFLYFIAILPCNSANCHTE